MVKILISTSSFSKEDPRPLEYCKKHFEVVLNPFGRTLKSDEIHGLASNAAGIIAGTEVYNESVLGKLHQLKVISRCGSGLDSIDLKSADKLGICILSTPTAPVQAVAELTLAMILDMFRKVTFMHQQLVSGKWEKVMGNLLFEKKVGLIGFGRIGRRVAKLLRPFTSNIVFYDIHVTESTEEAGSSTLDDLLKTCDVVSLHLAGAVKPILGRDELSVMKKGSFLVNVSRGGVIDETALYESLSSGHLGGAALDVFGEEPYHGPLIHLRNVVLTPHIGSYTKETRSEMEMEAAENLVNALKNLRVI